MNLNNTASYMHWPQWGGGGSLIYNKNLLRVQPSNKTQNQETTALLCALKVS